MKCFAVECRKFVFIDRLCQGVMCSKLYISIVWRRFESRDIAFVKFCKCVSVRSIVAYFIQYVDESFVVLSEYLL